MLSPRIRQFGFWIGSILVALGIIYLCLVVLVMLSGSSFPPPEPYQSLCNLFVWLTAVVMIIFWTILNQITPPDRKIFSQISLAFILVFATLTSINRYVALTVVRQSLSTGNTNGLQWFMPYSSPSIMFAIEYLAWGFFFGLACLFLVPVFRANHSGSPISWLLIVTGILSLLAVVGQLINSNTLKFDPFTFAGILAWGPGLTSVILLLTIRLKRSDKPIE